MPWPTAIEVRRSTGFENFGVPFCMTIEAECFKSSVDLGNESVEPRILEYGVNSLTEAAALPDADPRTHGRIPVVLEAVSLLSKQNGEAPVIGNLTGPVSLATSILDPLLYFRLMRKDPMGLHLFMETLTNFLSGFASALVEAGADIISIADPSATGEILGRNISGNSRRPTSPAWWPQFGKRAPGQSFIFAAIPRLSSTN